MESSSTPPFHYEPLSSDELSIRILTIQPAASLSDPLVCSLTNEIFSEIQPYDCISYVWGTQPPTKHMVLNGTEIKIRENLWNGLKRPRRTANDKENDVLDTPNESNGSVPDSEDLDPSITSRLLGKDRSEWRRLGALDMDTKSEHEGQARRLWADALCIDQRNIKERNWQVARMKDIYVTARKVCIWLGERENARKSSFVMEEFLYLLVRVGFDMHLMRPVLMKKMEAEFPAAISDLMPWLESEWWSRLWVLQEAATTQVDPVFFYGDEKVRWKTLSNFVVSSRHGSGWRLLQGKESNASRAGDSETLSHLTLTDIYMVMNMRSDYQKQHPQSIQQVVLQTERKHCTDERDRYYALLGLTQPQCKIKADYNLSVEVVRKLWLMELKHRESTHEELCLLVKAEEDNRVDVAEEWLPPRKSHSGETPAQLKSYLADPIAEDTVSARFLRLGLSLSEENEKGYEDDLP